MTIHQPIRASDPVFAGWTDDVIAKLKLLHAEGLSSSQIGLEIGTTRNAVIGKVHRLKLNVGRVKRTPEPRKRRPRPPAMPRVRIAATRRQRGDPNPGASSAFGRKPMPAHVEAFPAIVATDVPRLTLLELTEHTCKFPIGDPKHADFGFCGEALATLGPYCPVHAARAYTGIPGLKARVSA